MLFNLLSYTDEEIEVILRCAVEACKMQAVRMESPEGRDVLRRAIELYAAGVRSDINLLHRLTEPASPQLH